MICILMESTLGFFFRKIEQSTNQELVLTCHRTLKNFINIPPSGMTSGEDSPTFLGHIYTEFCESQTLKQEVYLLKNCNMTETNLWIEISKESLQKVFLNGYPLNSFWVFESQTIAALFLYFKKNLSQTEQKSDSQQKIQLFSTFQVNQLIHKNKNDDFINAWLASTYQFFSTNGIDISIEISEENSSVVKIEGTILKRSETIKNYQNILKQLSTNLKGSIWVTEIMGNKEYLTDYASEEPPNLCS